jgi:hypothetical protein
MTATRNAIALILLVALAGHGALLLESVRMSDDWSYLAWMGRDEWSTIHSIQLYANLPLLEYYFRAYSLFPDLLAGARLISFLIVAASGVFTFLLCRESGYLRSEDSTWVALVSMVYPGYLMHTSLTLSVFTFGYLLFLAAALLALLSERVSGARHAAARVAALVPFLLSFSVNSLLVYFGAFLVLHFLAVRRARALPWRAALAWYATRRADFLAAAPGFWLLQNAMKTFHETNPDYNVISFGVQNFASLGDFTSSIGAQWHMIVSSYWFVAAIPVAWLLARHHAQGVAAGAAPRGSLGGVLAFGLLLLLCGTLPYVVVGKTPHGDIEQWGTRLSLLLGLPIAIIAVALARMLQTYARLPPTAATALLAAVVVGSCAAQVKHYIRFLAGEIEARSLEVNLAANADAARVSVFGIVTRLPSFYATHQKYSWAYFLRTALGGELNRFAFMEGDVDVDASSRKRYSPDQIRAETDDWWFRLYGLKVLLDGAQATLLIEPGPGRRGIVDRRLVSRYLRTKWFAPERMDEFLRGVTTVTVIQKS